MKKHPWLIIFGLFAGVGIILYAIYQKTKAATSKLSNFTSSPLVQAAGTLLTQSPGITSSEIAAGTQVLNTIVGLFRQGSNPSINPAVDNFGISQAGTNIVYNDPNELPAGVTLSDITSNEADYVGEIGYYNNW